MNTNPKGRYRKTTPPVTRLPKGQTKDNPNEISPKKYHKDNKNTQGNKGIKKAPNLAVPPEPVLPTRQVAEKSKPHPP